MRQEKIKKLNKPGILIISNTLDFATDYVCLELQKRNANYIRLNRDEFDKYSILLDIFMSSLRVRINSKEFFIDTDSLFTIYYRAPVFLRDIYQPNLPKEEQLHRTQWMAFVKNLLIFESVEWINNPISTYKAENKMIQLLVAKKVGFQCPYTIVSNDNQLDLEDDKDYIVKSIDTALLRMDDKEGFVYSNKVKGCELKSASLNLAPVVIQDYIYPKIDVRVTVVGNTVYAVRILKNNIGIEGDWRREKSKVSYIPFKLPSEIEEKCIKVTDSLNLTFGAIDLIESNGTYYFLEINPTGEWGWLVDTAKLPIHETICNILEKAK